MNEREQRDLYEIIGCLPTATTEEIEKAYRKKSLFCHPDKNPDNPKAKDLFLQLKSALEILIDPQRRADYDRRVINAKFQAKLRTKYRDAKRKKLIDDLETRKAAARGNSPSFNEAQKRKAEIDRLQREGSMLLREAMFNMRQNILEELRKDDNGKCDEKFFRVKLKWKVEENDLTHGGYDYTTLHRILSKYGEVLQLIILAGKQGRGLVQFQSKEAAETAVKIERGLIRNPLTLEGLWTVKSKTKSYVDFEGSVLANLRQAEDRKNLVEEIRGKEKEGKEHG